MTYCYRFTLAAVTLSLVDSLCSYTDSPLSLPPNTYDTISCSASGAYPAEQTLALTATYHVGGYDDINVYLTSGASCGLSPDDGAFSYEYGENFQGASRALPTTPCGPTAPCCVLIWCLNSVFNCGLNLDYSLTLPPPPPSPTPSPSRGALPSPSAASSVGPSPVPTASPLYSRPTCNYSGTFSLPATSGADDNMFLTCKGALPGSPALTAYAAARMTNPNLCNVSLVGSTGCDVDPVTTSPAFEKGQLWTMGFASSFSSLNCGGSSVECCVMLLTDGSACAGLSLSWSVLRRADPPMPSRLPFVRPQLSNSNDNAKTGRLAGAIVGGVAALVGLAVGWYRNRDGCRCKRTAFQSEHAQVELPPQPLPPPHWQGAQQWPQQWQQQQQPLQQPVVYNPLGARK